MRERFSLRALLAGVAATPIWPARLSEKKSPQPDAELIALGRQFDELAEVLDRSGWKDEAAMSDFTAVEKTIMECEAVTAAGLSVKARAVSWALLGDLDPSDVPAADKKIAVSVVRDVIRVHARRLEEQAALMKLASLMLSL